MKKRDDTVIERYPMPVVAWMIDVGWVKEWPMEFTREGRYFCTTRVGQQRSQAHINRATVQMRELSTQRHAIRAARGLTW